MAFRSAKEAVLAPRVSRLTIAVCGELTPSVDDTEHDDDSACRPNQLVAGSLDHEVLGSLHF